MNRRRLPIMMNIRGVMKVPRMMNVPGVMNVPVIHRGVVTLVLTLPVVPDLLLVSAEGQQVRRSFVMRNKLCVARLVRLAARS